LLADSEQAHSEQAEWCTNRTLRQMIHDSMNVDAIRCVEDLLPQNDASGAVKVYADVAYTLHPNDGDRTFVLLADGAKAFLQDAIAQREAPFVSTVDTSYTDNVPSARDAATPSQGPSTTQPIVSPESPTASPNTSEHGSDSRLSVAERGEHDCDSHRSDDDWEEERPDVMDSANTRNDDGEDDEDRPDVLDSTNNGNDDGEDDEEDNEDLMDFVFSNQIRKFDYAGVNDDGGEKDADDAEKSANLSPDKRMEEEEVYKATELEAEVHAQQNYGRTPTVHNHFFHKYFGNATTGKYCMEREEFPMDGSRVGHKLKHTPPGQILGGQTYMDGLRTVTQRQTQPKLWDSLLHLPVLVAEMLRRSSPNKHTREKLANILEGLDETLPTVMGDIEQQQGMGIRHEVYLRVDGAFRRHVDEVGMQEGIGVSLPPVDFPPFISAKKHGWAQRYKDMTLPLLRSLLHCFPPASIRGESGPSPYHYPSEVKNCLLAHADLIAIEFSSFSGSYKGTIMKGMWNKMLREFGGAIAVPEAYKEQIDAETRDLYCVEYGVKSQALLLPTLGDALANLESSDWWTKPDTVGLAGTVALARNRLVKLPSTPRLGVTYEIMKSHILALLHAYAVIGEFECH
jgi:hypothetical protein